MSNQAHTSHWVDLLKAYTPLLKVSLMSLKYLKRITKRHLHTPAIAVHELQLPRAHTSLGIGFACANLYITPPTSLSNFSRRVVLLSSVVFYCLSVVLCPKSHCTIRSRAAPTSNTHCLTVSHHDDASSSDISFDWPAERSRGRRGSGTVARLCAGARVS